MEDQTSPQTDMESAAEAKAPRKKTDKRVQALIEELDSAKVELADKTDKFLRLAADYDNFRKRKIREFDELMATANERLLRELIPIVDDFERALASARQTQDMDAFRQGIEMIQQHLMDVLVRQGLQTIQTVGQPFDPYRHEAVMVVERTEVAPDQVVEEMQKGYTLNDKVLRAAKVVVST
jgi:molecular chaperone GrpE